MEGEGIAPDIAAQISQLKMASSSTSTSTPTTTDDTPPVTTPVVDITNVMADTDSAASSTSDLKEPNPRPHPSTSMTHVYDTDKRIPELFSKNLSSDEQEQEEEHGAAAVEEELKGYEATDEKIAYEYEDEEEVVLKEGSSYGQSDYTTSSVSSHIDICSVTPAPEVYPATPPAIRAIRRRLVGERSLHTTTTTTSSVNVTATSTTATTTATAAAVANSNPAVAVVQDQRMNGYDSVDGTLKSILVLLGAFIVFLSYKMIDILFGPLI